MDKSKFKRQGNIFCPLVAETPKIHGKGHGCRERWRIGTNDAISVGEWLGHRLVRSILGAPPDTVLRHQSVWRLMAEQGKVSLKELQSLHGGL